MPAMRRPGIEGTTVAQARRAQSGRRRLGGADALVALAHWRCALRRATERDVFAIPATASRKLPPPRRRRDEHRQRLRRLLAAKRTIRSRHLSGMAIAVRARRPGTAYGNCPKVLSEIDGG